MSNHKLGITGWPDLSDEELEEFEETLDSEDEELLAMGTYVGPAQQVFLVQIEYRDPPIAGATPGPTQQWKLEVSADTEEQAKQLAVKDFRLIEGLSNGDWRREIVDIRASETD